MLKTVVFGLLLGLAGFAYGQGKEAEAKEHFGKAINHTVLGEVDKAVAEYERAIELYPNYADALYNLGALYYNEGLKLSGTTPEAEAKAAVNKAIDANFRKAAEYFERVVTINPKDALTLGNLKQIYVSLEEYGKADVVKKKLDALAGDSK